MTYLHLHFPPFPQVQRSGPSKREAPPTNGDNNNNNNNVGGGSVGGGSVHYTDPSDRSDLTLTMIFTVTGADGVAMDTAEPSVLSKVLKECQFLPSDYEFCDTEKW